MLKLKDVITVEDVKFQPSLYSSRYEYAAVDGSPLTEEEIRLADGCSHHYNPASIGRDYYYHFKGSSWDESYFAHVSASGNVTPAEWIKVEGPAPQWYQERFKEETYTYKVEGFKKPSV